MRVAVGHRGSVGARARRQAGPGRPRLGYDAAVSDVALVLLLLIVLALIWRGPKTLPKLGQALGRGIREARREAQELTGGQAGTPAGEGGTAAEPPVEAPRGQSRDA
ncbi:MAG: hypothetical protein KatS3mg065_1184 [Chloroflexota bacterium]|nr:MAG: hypothetical protein KatS3mg065_1184 [Chloroflexota bacterium]